LENVLVLGDQSDKALMAATLCSFAGFRGASRLPPDLRGLLGFVEMLAKQGQDGFLAELRAACSPSSASADCPVRQIVMRR
jgi:hypothetical protein